MRRTVLGLMFLGACGGKDAMAADDGPAFVPGTLQGLLVDHLPRAVGGKPLTVVQLPAEALAAAEGPALAALDLSAAQVEVALAYADGITILAVHTPGRGVQARLSALSAEAGKGVVQQTRLGPFEGARRIPAASPSWLLDAGDTAVAVSAQDDATGRTAASAVAGALDGALGPMPAKDPPADAFGGGPLQMTWMLRPFEPACVGEPPGRLHWLGIAIDTRLIPRADITYFYTSPFGRQLPEFGAGAADVTYSRDSFGDGADDFLNIKGMSYLGGQTVEGVPGQTQFTIPVQHCLNGTWTDDDRVLTISQRRRAITATITTGALCGATGTAFSGALSEVPFEGNTFQGDDLLTCNPQECVDAGLLPATTTATFTAKVGDDGRSVDFTWTRILFDTVQDDMGKVTACTVKPDTEDRSFSIERQTFGPDLPF